MKNNEHQDNIHNIEGKYSSDFHNIHLHSNPRRTNSKYYVELNRLLYSKTCIYIYIFLISSSVTIFLYSIFAYIFKLNETPILVCESILITVLIIDTIIRVYVTGCRKYFTKLVNILDLFLISLNFVTIFLYMKFHSTAQDIEDISFALLIFIRNSSQLLRLVVLFKNQKVTSNNVDEIINLNELFEERKYEILSMKKETSANFFEEEHKVPNVELTIMNVDFNEIQMA